MKKIVFSLMTLFALALMAGSANAANEKTVFPGGTYTYNLTGVYSFNAATAVVTYSGSGASITELSGSYTIAAETASTVSFEVEYGTTATSGTFTVEITDGTSSCANSIELNITVSPLPTYTLTIVADEIGYSSCQARTGAGDNTPDALRDDSEANSFTFTVTPVIQNVPSTYNYSYTISLPTGTGLLSFDNGSSAVTGYSGGVVTRTGVSSNAPDVFTVTFNTTTGIDSQTLTAALTAASSTLTLDAADGGGSYTATIASGGNSTQSVSVNAVPTIGGFN